MSTTNSDNSSNNTSNPSKMEQEAQKVDNSENEVKVADNNDNNSNDAETTPAKRIKLAPPGEPDLRERIVKQLNYYFSDLNVIRDKFLLEEFKKNDNWVKISTLLTFVRLKELTQDEGQVCEALKEFESDIIELDEPNKQVRRRHPIPDKEELQKQIDQRSVHISGFPTDYNFEALRRFCSQFGEVEAVLMRRHFKTRFFKGCIHTTFKREEDAKKVLETENLKCKDRELKKESMEDYHKRKAEFRESKKLRRSQHDTKPVEPVEKVETVETVT